LSDDNSNYAATLINGDSLLAWHARPDWQSKAERSRRFPVTHFDARQKTIVRMAMTAIATVKGSGAISEIIKKDKEFRFRDQFEMEHHLAELLDIQEGLCALTGLAMVLDGEDGDPELRCSLDRIDSNGHYQRGNLQVVCKFANRWKGSSDNADFLRLLEMLCSSTEIQ
jgi:hypothetical protein